LVESTRLPFSFSPQSRVFRRKTQESQTKTYVFVWEAPIKSLRDFIEARPRPAKKRDWRTLHVTSEGNHFYKVESRGFLPIK